MGFNVGGKTTPDKAAERWVSGAQGKGSKWVEGYTSPDKNPFDAAHAQSQHWLNQVSAAKSKFENGLTRAKGREEEIVNWVKANGATAYKAGIDKGAHKVKKAFATLIPKIQEIAAALPKRGDAEANDNRMLEMVKHLRALKGAHRG